MSNLYHATASQDGLTVAAYRGDGSALLGFSVDEHGAQGLAGFAIQLTAPSQQPVWLKNRLNFSDAITQATTPQERQGIWTDSNQAPFQRFRWQHFVPQVVDGDYVYDVTAMYFSGSGLKPGSTASLSLPLSSPSLGGNVQIGFTRSYVSSQAYAEKFGEKPLRQMPKTLQFSTGPYAEQYEFLGYTARKMIFQFLNECLQDDQISLDVFAYDFDEPDILACLQKMGSRLRFYLDDAPLHTASTALEPQAKKLLAQSAGETHVKTGHFRRFAHNKVFIQKKGGKTVKVLTGSANFSIRGLYVQANNVLVFTNPQMAGLYQQAFDQAWNDPKPNAPGFAASPVAGGWFDVACQDLPPISFCFSPHKDGNVSLSRVLDALNAARSSVMFAIMELGGGGDVLSKLSSMATQSQLFSYGVTQHLSADMQKDLGVSVHGPSRSSQAAPHGVLVPFAYLHKQVPQPFRQEISGGQGQVIHNKFIVVDFNDSNPVVFTGSSNLADGGEECNGDNLIEIRDPQIATLYGVEAARLVEHFGFRAAMQGATAKAPLRLDTTDGWCRPYYDSNSLRYTERLLFVK
jgi:hypothetical protein